MSRNRRTATRKATSRKAPQAPWRAAANAAIRNVETLAGQAGELGQVGVRFATDAIRSTRESVARRAGEARARAAALLAGVENAVAENAYRVASRIGVPTARDMRAISGQVARLQQSVEQLRRPRARA